MSALALLAAGCDREAPGVAANGPATYEPLELAAPAARRLPDGAMERALPAWEPDTVVRRSWVSPTDVDLRGEWAAVADPEGPRVHLAGPPGSGRGFGRRGQGPEEFMAPRAVALVEGGVWVLDGSSNRITRWSLEGGLEEARPARARTTLRVSGDSLVEASAVQVRLDSRRGLLAVLDSTAPRLVHLGHTGERLTREERERITAHIGERVGSAGSRDDERAAGLVSEYGGGYTHKDRWQLLAHDRATGAHLLVHQDPDVLGPRDARLLVLDADLESFRAWSLPGAVVDLAADGGRMAALVTDPETGGVHLAVGTY